MGTKRGAEGWQEGAAVSLQAARQNTAAASTPFLFPTPLLLRHCVTCAYDVTLRQTLFVRVSCEDLLPPPPALSRQTFQRLRCPLLLFWLLPPCMQKGKSLKTSRKCSYRFRLLHAACCTVAHATYGKPFAYLNNFTAPLLFFLFFFFCFLLFCCLVIINV